MTTPSKPPTRRRFFVEAAKRTGGAGMAAALLASIREAAAIQAEPGSTFLDAEHVVILMQENRSFDHVYGTLRGVRGFNDPRAVVLPDQRPVWFQSNAAGETYAPFRMDIRETNATWLGSLPHSWRDQTDAHNDGNHDGWLEAKRSGRTGCGDKPFTLGYYNREDLPFYYSLADAFTVCDQNFCSSLTGTTPNRLHLWTGTVRETQDENSVANVWNSDVTYGAMARWKAFPERLEEAGIPWKIYQNELSVSTGLSGEQEAWLANFTDNPIEWFEQYGVFYAASFRRYAVQALKDLPGQIAALDAKIAANPSDARLTRERRSRQRELEMVRRASETYTEETFRKLSPRERSLHERAFSTNTGDPHYRELTTLRYSDGGKQRSLEVPKGDVLHQFREDVRNARLPAVSWIVPPENFSDHPGAPWYGAWMLSEVLQILTQNPNVWKKTIFILCYDENDGYFDHVPPFTPPAPGVAEKGKCSAGLDPGVEYWPLERDRARKTAKDARGGPIGLGFRVPLVIASPWSRGGTVCSQVFDHTSVLQLLEKILSRRYGKPVHESNISSWRRAVCGDLTSVFQPAGQAPEAKLNYPERDAVVRRVHQASFKEMPAGYRKLSAEDLAQYAKQPHAANWMSRQEPGTKPSMALPYQLYASGKLSADRRSVELVMEARKDFFGERSAGAPFHVYTPGLYRGQSGLRTRAYAVAPGEQLNDTWALEGFPDGEYHLCVCGPNGFLREVRGSAADPLLTVGCGYLKDGAGKPAGDVEFQFHNLNSSQSYRIEIVDRSYKAKAQRLELKAGEQRRVICALSGSHSWYDFAIRVDGNTHFARILAGRVETGRIGVTDPAMSGLT